MIQRKKLDTEYCHAEPKHLKCCDKRSFGCGLRLTIEECTLGQDVDVARPH